MFQEVSKTLSLEDIVRGAAKHYKTKTDIDMKFCYVHPDAFPQGEEEIKVDDIIVRKDKQIGKTYFWFFSEEPPRNK